MLVYNVRVSIYREDPFGVDVATTAISDRDIDLMPLLQPFFTFSNCLSIVARIRRSQDCMRVKLRRLLVC